MKLWWAVKRGVDQLGGHQHSSIDPSPICESGGASWAVLVARWRERGWWELTSPKSLTASSMR